MPLYNLDGIGVTTPADGAFWVAPNAVLIGKVKLETRSGNTAKPGTGWSEWQAPGGVAKLGGGNEGGKIASPPGRYLQFRVALEDDAARVRRVGAPRCRRVRCGEQSVILGRADRFWPVLGGGVLFLRRGRGVGSGRLG